jgi:hypothetical protein
MHYTRVFNLMSAALALAAGAALAQGDGRQFVPFVMNHRAAGESPADVSFLLERPAGKDGFIQIRNGHLAKGNGERIRFWGVHLTDWSKGSVMLPPKEDIPMWASTLARFGVNLVRLHFLDLFAPRGIIDNTRDDSRAFDPDQLDRLDFLVSELKKRGIYVNLNLNVGRSYKAGDGVQGYDRIRWGKGLVIYDPRLIELLKEYSRQILTHVNPYTKTEYRNERAMAIVEILNENALYAGFRAPTPYHDELLTRMYNEWLSGNRTPEQLGVIRAQAGVDTGSPVPRLKGPEISSAPKERYEAEMAFFMETEDKFYQGMYSYLKKTLGVKVPVVATSDHSHSGSSYPMLATISKLDIVDGHVYWQHPGSRVMNTPMVDDPLNSTVVQLSRTAVAGKPYTVSETNHPFPNDWASEGIPIIASYGRFQDWDAIVLYTFEPKRELDWKAYIGDPFDISLDPVRMTQMASGALIFLRGDVKAAARTITRTYSKQQMLESRRLPASEQPYFTPGFPLWLPLIHAVRIASFDGPPAGPIMAPRPNPLVSDTGELAWELPGTGGGVVTVNTAHTQAIIGFFKERPKTLNNFSAQVENRFGSLVLSSLDGKPVAESARLLLAAGSRVANTGMTWNEARNRVTAHGGPPSLIEPIKGTVALRNLKGAAQVSIRALDGAGKPLGDALPGSLKGGEWVLPVGDPATTWYVIDVRRR